MQEWMMAILATGLFFVAINSWFTYFKIKSLQDEARYYRDIFQFESDKILTLEEKVESLTDCMIEITDQFKTVLEKIQK